LLQVIEKFEHNNRTTGRRLWHHIWSVFMADEVGNGWNWG